MAFNLLIVDDSSVMRAMILRILHLSGLPLGEVHEAANGREALAVLERNWIDLALVDLNMPVMSGEELIDKVRMDPANKNLAILVVSTETSNTRIDKLRGQGVDFVHKPFTPEMLRKKILEMTGVSDAEQTGSGTLQGGGPDF
jgi:two-component system chemotaxis response regulator CheY